MLTCADFVPNDLVGFQVGVLGKTWGSEAQERLGKEDTLHSYCVTWGALAHIVTDGSDFEGAGNVANRDLVARLLNLEVLVRLKLARADDHVQGASRVV